MNLLNTRCILTHEQPGNSAAPPFISLPQANCAGNPPDDPNKLYPLCLDCDLFHQQADRALFAKLAAYVTESNAAAVDQDTSLKLGYAAVLRMLERLSLGDPDARVVLPLDVRFFRDLEPFLNRMAEFIKGQVEESHEFAMGLCEHYETLMKLARGELESRASEDSPVELIAKLGELINSHTEAFQVVLGEHKKAEAEREQLRDQLHHAQKLDSVGQLAGGIAHEFNNILAAILGYAGILEKRLGADSPNLPAVHRIISASEKAASLTRGMLAFSRKQVVSLEPTSLNSIIAGMKEMLCRLAGENIHIDFYPDPLELTLNADLGQLQQIILNLYNNAREAMPDGGSLTISTSRSIIVGFEDDAPANIPPGRYVRLTVTDTGYGISPEKLPRIFDPFFSTKEVGKGTGLGLSIVFGIVQQHKGFIKVTSSAGHGATFSIWFPEHDKGGHNYFADASSGSRPEELGTETILVGEDNEDVRPMIVELLQDIGYQVLEARNGAEVVTLMENFGDTVDLLLLDVIMPHLNGYEVLSNVRRSYPDVPCLFLSGYSDDILKQKAKFPGDFKFLSKPIMPDKLLKAVRTALDIRRMQVTSPL